jgi:hypothetical protein
MSVVIYSYSKQGQCQRGWAAVLLDELETQILQVKRLLAALCTKFLPLRIILTI